MRQLIMICLALSTTITVAAQRFQPRIYGGLCMSRHSYLPQGEVPDRKYTYGLTSGAQALIALKESNACLLLGVDYSQKGGKLLYDDGRAITTMYDMVGFEIGSTNQNSDEGIGHVLRLSASLTTSFLMSGKQTISFNGIDSTRNLVIGKADPADLFHLSIGFRVGFTVNLGSHFDLDIRYQGSFNELDLVSGNNLRDKGFLFTLGYKFRKPD